MYVESFRQHYAPAPFHVTQYLGWITFADGTRWSADELRLRLNQGTAGADFLDGDYRAETIRGGAGDDRIRTWGGDDLLDGGSGSDALDGGSGSDTYLIRRGEGKDVITDLSDGQPHRDSVQFGPGIGPANVRFYRSLSEWDLDLHIQIDGDPGALKITSFFWGGLPGDFWRWSVEEFRFEDGTVWTDEEIRARMLAGTAESQSLFGYFGDDTILGLDGHDRIHGMEGNDRLEGGNGDDRLFGGMGNDWLDGGSGSNVYVFEGEVGRDVIASRSQPLQGDPGQIQIHHSVLAPDVVVLRRVGNDLEIVESSSSAANAVLIQDYFRDNTSANPWNPVQSIGWWGHSSWDLASIDSRVTNLYRGGRADDPLTGTADHDFLEGFAGNDTLHGGLGNDRLDGGEGIDTASWAGMTTSVTVDLALAGPQETGAGQDTLVSIENLIGGAGADRLLGHGGDNRIDGGAGDDTIDGGAGSDVLLGGLGVDTVSFASAPSPATVDLANTRAQRTVGTWSDTITGFENLVGSAWNDTLTGSSGANQIHGGAGADLIRGGEGADRLTGGPGADRFSYGSPAEAGLGAAGRDLITDLESIDRIDLSLIDAHSSLKGNQAFVFIGSAAFSAPAQLRYFLLGSEGLLEGNVDNNLAADFQIALAGAPALTAGWLVL
ncbi:M10 family metallopeptidase C-terminal domain-containing protein [Cyanobium sp. FGCU-6]|nr:M10 family metallopeptidase C-terminal domain-containing protein [Cyanobium sp. FGCU6]